MSTPLNVALDDRTILLYENLLGMKSQVIIPCTDLADYVAHAQTVRDKVLQHKPSEVLRFFSAGIFPLPYHSKRNPLRHVSSIQFQIDDLIIEDVRDSAYVTEKNAMPISDGLFVYGFTQERVCVRRRDFMLQQGTQRVVAYIELSEETDKEVWSRIMFAKPEDNVQVLLGRPSQAQPPCAELYQLWPLPRNEL